MSLTLEQPRSAAAENARDVQWRAHQPGIWVAHDTGHFMGMVQHHWSSGFSVTTRFGKRLGPFTTLEEARTAVEREADPAPVGG